MSEKLMSKDGKSWKNPLRSKKAILLLVIVFGIAGFTGYKKVAVHYDKQHFINASEELEKIYTQIEATVGKADEIKQENDCSYSSAKFSKGRLSCSVGVSLIYNNLDINESSRHMLTASSVLDTPFYGYEYNSIKGFASLDPQNTEQTYTQEFAVNSNYYCRVLYTHPVPAKNDPAKDRLFSGLNLRLRCSGEAIAEHFPVKD